MFQVKMSIVAYFGSYLAMQKEFRQCKIKNFKIPKKQTGKVIVMQNFKATAQQTAAVDPLIFESVAKMHCPKKII